MADLKIHRVTTRRQKRQFLDFPWVLYAGDPNWVPPLRSNQKELVGYAPHPFYVRNSVQTFIATRGDEVCGRIAAILNQGHNVHYNERRGFFGFFECRDDQEAAAGLFDAVRQWFADQGVYKLRGPTNPSLNYELGLLIDGFDSQPTFMMTYNPPYYERLIENYGFRKTQDLYAFWGHLDMLPAIAAKLKPIADQIVDRYNVKLRPMDKSKFKEDVRMFLSLYNRSMTNTWGFVPMTPAEVDHMAEGLRFLIVPEMTVAAEIDGQVVGVAFGLPDYNPRIKEIKGRLFPFGVFHLLRNRRAIKKIRLISTNVLPEYQRYGVGLVLMQGLVPKAMEWGLQEAEFSWVLESNSLSYGSLKKGGAKITKTYRLYDYEGSERSGQWTVDSGQRTEDSGQRAVGSGQLEIREVRTSADLKDFIRIPWRIYRNDPHWVPPLIVEVKEFLNRRKHPFYMHGDAAQFLVLRDGQPLGRILASDDPRYNEGHASNLGCFGMFECVNDRQAAHALLDAATAWLRARGRTEIRGPIDYSTNYPCGLLIDGFNTPPRVMMNHNPMYYAGLLESWGLTKAKDIYAWWFEDKINLEQRWRHRVERIVKRTGITIRHFDNKDFEADVARCREVYNSAMHDLWGFVNLSDAEFHHLARRLRKIAQEEQILLAELDGKPVGFSVTIPDINEAIRPLKGRLTTWGLPLGFLRLLRRMKKISTARVVILNVLEGYRRRGVAEALILRTLDYGKNVLHYSGAELSWTHEDNAPINQAIESVGGQRYKTYRIFQKGIRD
ncbi:MAG: GNAT family N-acetyltransferase [Thermoguttaceae bacterium]|jgi:GNAT superfamily N-acetyltransferase